MSVSSFLEWLEGTRWSVALIESLYVWPLLESAHVLTLGLFVGTVLMMDLRLLGIGFRSVPAWEFTGRVLPWTRAGFAVMAVTGFLLFYSSPLGYYHNLFFRIKILLLVMAALNAWVFHARTHRLISQWGGGDRVPPRGARIAAVLSIAAWTGVVVAGRLTAYNWFDCDLQPKLAVVRWAAGCPLPGQ